MPNNTPFTIQITDLTSLGQDRSVESFRRLLWAEAGSVGIGKNIINVPQCINVGDGGIDAFIENANPSNDEVIPKGSSGFQIKSSDLYPGECEKELHIEGDVNQALKPEIKKILDQDYTYILVLFADLTNKKISDRLQSIKNELARLGYSNAKIRLYSASQLQGFIEKYPSLIAWFKHDSSQCSSYLSWSGCRDISSPKVFIFDDERKKIKDEIQEKIRNPEGQCRLFRISGLSGIGKTRFVYEVLSPNDLRERVIYVQADTFRFTNLYQTLQNDQNLSAIIVIDECDLQTHEEFVKLLSSRGERLVVFTLSYEIGNTSPPSIPYKIDRLQPETIEMILRAEIPALPGDIIKRLSQFADGYPRIGVLLAESYLTNKGGSQKDFLDISNDALMDRLIGGRDTSSEHFRKTKKVLQGLSLFSKVGYKGKLSKEAEWVADLVGVDFKDVQEIVAEQKYRGIIQGDHYIYVTPFMLRIYLTKSWWETYGFTKEKFEEFVDKIPKEFKTEMLERFFDNLPYISTSEKGRDFAKAILGSDGLFADGTLLQTQLGGDFFLSLTEADPSSALQCLKSTIEKQDREELLKFKTGRREVVWALEKIAVWKDLFSDSARVLAILGEAENESCSNNASGTFSDLFSPGPGGVAPTEASPEDRFPVLKETLESDSKEKRKLALDACNKALESNYFHRMVGAEYQGLRKEAKLWSPINHQETVDAYIRVWKLLYDKLDSFKEDERQYAIKILLGHIRGLTKILGLTEIITQDINGLIDKKYVNKKDIVDAIEGILHYDKKRLPISVVKKWEEIRDSLVGTDFHSLMERYVGMDLLEDKFDDDGNHVDKAEEPIKKLVKQAILDPKLLIPELEWLHTQEAKSGYRFGYELGLQDKKFSLLPVLLEAQKKVVDNKEASDFFLGGYLKAFFELDQKGWENLFDTLTKDEKLKKLVPVLTWRSGMSDRSALRVLKLAKEKVIPPSDFSVFGLGSVISDLDEGVFQQWIEFLLNCPEDYVASIALDLYQFFYIRKESKYTLPEKLTYRVLTQPSLFKEVKDRFRNQMDEWHWKEVGNKFVETYPDDTVLLAEVILENFGKKGGIFEDFYSETQEVLLKITEKHPLEVWDIVIKYLGPPIDSRAFHIREWLRGSGFFEERSIDALSFFSEEKIWEWVDEDINKRAWYIAYIAPKSFFKQEGKTCWAREILARYGDREDVSKEMGANFYTEGWTGPASQHYQKKKIELLAFKQGEDNENVKKWIDEMIDSLEKHIEHEKIQEERRGF